MKTEKNMMSIEKFKRLVSWSLAEIFAQTLIFDSLNNRFPRQNFPLENVKLIK